jgi:hypothetical protein
VQAPLTLITENDDGTIIIETGRFESDLPGSRLPAHLGRTLLSLSRSWKAKQDLYPQGDGGLAVKYLWRLSKFIPGVYETDRKGFYRLARGIALAKYL